MQLRKTEEELELFEFDAGGWPMFKYKQVLFTGILVAYEDDGSLAVEEEYKDGCLDGWVRSYYPNGLLSEEFEIHNNKVVPGTFREWSEDGNLTGSF